MPGALQRLDHTKAQPTRYCIETWLRDEQIKLALQRPIGRIAGPLPVREDPIAIVGYGPSLNDTWEQVKDYTFSITGSGSHKFMVERGVIPTWHVEVDPRPHKVELIGPPHPDVEYLIASACHPKVFDHLANGNVKLWHIFSNEEDALRTLPRGEWALTGGSNVGLRCLTIARFFGFVNFHIFGMDGCDGQSGIHAAAHPNQPKGRGVVEYGGRSFTTTPAMLECARQTFHELDELKDVTATFYGDGLVQAMAKDYKPKRQPGTVAIGLNRPPVITEAYRAQNAQLHRDNLAYGVGGGKHAKTVLKLADSIGSRAILDYGCGKGYLAKALPFPIWEYDPAIQDRAESPRPADLVVCTDVLEHIEPELLVYVLDDLRRCVLKVGYFVIHTGPALKKLPDGRNTHLIQRGRNWWNRKLSRFFTIGQMIERGPELHVVVGPLKGAKSRAA